MIQAILEDSLAVSYKVTVLPYNPALHENVYGSLFFNNLKN